MEMNPLLKAFVNSPLWAGLLERTFLPPLFAAIEGAPARALEIGCGRGDTTRMLFERFPAAKIAATDYDAAQVSLATERLMSPRVSFLQADAAKLPFPDASFDLVVELNTFHHVERWVAAMREVARVLAPGGRFAVMDEPMETWSPLLRWFDKPDAIFNSDEFLFAATDAGFTLEKRVPGTRIIRAVFKKT